MSPSQRWFHNSMTAFSFPGQPLRLGNSASTQSSLWILCSPCSEQRMDSWLLMQVASIYPFQAPSSLLSIHRVDRGTHANYLRIHTADHSDLYSKSTLDDRRKEVKRETMMPTLSCLMYTAEGILILGGKLVWMSLFCIERHELLLPSLRFNHFMYA